MHTGLHQQIARKRALLKQARAIAADPDSGPQTEHSANHAIASLPGEIETLCTSAHTGENAFAQIEEAHAKLAAMQCGSAELMLAIRDLETASFRLRRHLGENPG